MKTNPRAVRNVITILMIVGLVFIGLSGCPQPTQSKNSDSDTQEGDGNGGGGGGGGSTGDFVFELSYLGADPFDASNPIYIAVFSENSIDPPSDWAAIKATADGDYAIDEGDIPTQSPSHEYVAFVCHDVGGDWDQLSEPSGMDTVGAYDESSPGHVNYGLANMTIISPGLSSTYAISYDAPGADSFEPDDTAGEADTYTVGSDGLQLRTFHRIGNPDWIEFSAVAGTTYTITTSSTGQHETDTILYLDSDGNLADGYLAEDDDGGTGWYSSLSYTSYITQTLYVGVFEFTDLLGEYAFRIETNGGGPGIPADPYEPDDSAAQASTYVVGTDGVQSRTFHQYGDIDYVQFSVVATQTYTVVTSSTGQDNCDTMIVLDDNGLVSDGYLAEDDDGGTGLYSQLEYTAVQDGTLYVIIGEFGDETGRYGLRIF
jgi:hypothetical protein